MTVTIDNPIKQTSVVFVLCVFLCVFPAITADTSNSDNNTPPMKRMDHVGINVTDLERSADWYQKVLGFTVYHKWKTTWMIRRSDMRNGLFLRPNAKKIDDLDNTLAITHFAYATTNKGFKEAQERLTKLGVKFDPPEDTGVAHSIFIYDPDGYQVEITNYYK
jgi:catechol 2,3-dioxygenase-like lactoylglutathione lyase family enzyme